MEYLDMICAVVAGVFLLKAAYYRGRGDATRECSQLLNNAVEKTRKEYLERVLNR